MNSVSDHFSLTRIFKDPSSGQINNGFFNGTALIALETTLPDKSKSELLALITVLSMKLSSLWEIKELYHSRLQIIKDELLSEQVEGKRNVKMNSVQATELLAWFDVFLVQIKSILDHLVKIPSPVFGYNKWSLATFGEKGEKVKKSFNNLPKEYKKRTTGYYDYIFGRHHWIEEAIEIRDKINHGVRGGVDPKLFTVTIMPNKERFIEPMWSNEQTIFSAMGVIFSSMIKLSSEFCGMILALKLPDELTVICDSTDEITNKPVCSIIKKEILKQQLESQGIEYKGG